MDLRRLVSGLAVGTAVLALVQAPVRGSSHREAPFITKHPKVDGTDFYAFMSYETGRPDFVTLIANYLPLQDAYGGPNYFTMDPEALYEIHVDNNGDGQEDITFQFRFQNTLQEVDLPVGGQMVNVPLTTFNLGSLVTQVVETYSVKVVRGNRRTGTSADLTDMTGQTVFTKPADNVGQKTIPDYHGYASQFIYDVNIPGCGMPGRVFVGQRQDPFVVNLGQTFDTLNYVGTTPKNELSDKNVTSIALEIHKSCLTAGGDPVIGAWTTASMRQARLLNPAATFAGPTVEGGPWVQVSRLGMPLVNEVVIGLKDKDKFNASEPKDDLANFATYITNPTLPTAIEAILGPALGVSAPSTFPRSDLVDAFALGLLLPDGMGGTINLNRSAAASPVPSEMVRLNTGIAPTPLAMQNNLGVIGGDLAGFPNGRRPGDDVVDVELRVAMGLLLCVANGGTCPASAPSGDVPFSDGANTDPTSYPDTFPYVNDPLPGSP